MLMIMSSRLRKLALTSHVTSSVGWLGAVAAYLVLALVGLTSLDGEMARAAYRVMEMIGWAVIVPFALASLLSGLIQSLGTEWGLLRHYWIVTKLALTVAATAVLLMHVPTVSRMAQIAIATTLSTGDFRLRRIQLVVMRSVDFWSCSLPLHSRCTSPGAGLGAPERGLPGR